MDSLLLLKPPFEEALILIPRLVGSTGPPPCSHAPPPTYLSAPSLPLLLLQPLGPAKKQLLGVYTPFLMEMMLYPISYPRPTPPPPPWMSSLLLTNQREGERGGNNGQSRPSDNNE